METFIICFRARLKKGWVEWDPSRRELAWGASRFAMDTTHLEENLLVEPSQARPDVELEHDFQTTSLDTGFETGSVSYTPSIAKTDFAEFLPGQKF